MTKILTFILAAALSSIMSLPLLSQSVSNTRNCIPCEQLKSLGIPDAVVLQAKSLTHDTIDGQVINVPFCYVTGRISKEINFELLLPANWNKRFLMSGGGGFVGSIQDEFRSKVNSGFVTAGTDAGHQGSPIQATWGLNNMERQLDFGKLAIHLTAEVSKFIIRSYYCQDAAYSYFWGCSRGGGQAMMEAQQYPDDFQGIIAGAPAFSWPATGAKFVQNSQKNYPDPNNAKSVITKDNLRLLQAQVLKQCDTLDGIKDGIVNNPGACKFDFSSLPLCPNDQAAGDCFTSKQMEAVKIVYSPLLDKGDKDTIYPGFPLGAENEHGGWDIWIAGTQPNMGIRSLHYMFSVDMFKYLVFNDPTWDYSKYDFSNFRKETTYASAYLDATSTDYSEFKKHKGKMIMYHGWNDPALSAFSTIQYYRDVEQRDRDVQSYFRLFLLPGVLHCSGGPGPDETDWLQSIQEWVENDKAPERVIMTKKENGKVAMSRPVFPFPGEAVYSGKGDPSREENFVEKRSK